MNFAKNKDGNIKKLPKEAWRFIRKFNNLRKRFYNILADNLDF